MHAPFGLYVPILTVLLRQCTRIWRQDKGAFGNLHKVGKSAKRKSGRRLIMTLLSECTSQHLAACICVGSNFNISTHLYLIARHLRWWFPLVYFFFLSYRFFDVHYLVGCASVRNSIIRICQPRRACYTRLS